MVAEVLIGFVLSHGMGEQTFVPASEVRVQVGRVEAAPFFQLPNKLETGDGRYYGGDLRVHLGGWFVGGAARRYETSKWTKVSYRALAGRKLNRWQEVHLDFDLTTINAVRGAHLRTRVWRIETDFGAYTYLDDTSRRRAYGASVGVMVALGNRGR